MRFDQTLIPATLIRRYKRFLAEVRLEDGGEITVHCPNSGSMRGCAAPGTAVMISVAANPKRKYRHTLEMVRVDGYWVGINTWRTNGLVEEAIGNGLIPGLTALGLRREVKSGASRLDFLLKKDHEKIWLEVKNCTLAEGRAAMFPDAVTSRGKRHLLELMRARENGDRAIIFFCVQRQDCDFFTPAADIDPAYAAALDKAVSTGVEIMVWQARVSPEEITIFRPLPVMPGPENCDVCGKKIQPEKGQWQDGEFSCPPCRDENHACGCEGG